MRRNLNAERWRVSADILQHLVWWCPMSPGEGSRCEVIEVPIFTNRQSIDIATMNVARNPDHPTDVVFRNEGEKPLTFAQIVAPGPAIRLCPSELSAGDKDLVATV